MIVLLKELFVMKELVQVIPKYQVMTVNLDMVELVFQKINALNSFTKNELNIDPIYYLQ